MAFEPRAGMQTSKKKKKKSNYGRIKRKTNEEIDANRCKGRNRERMACNETIEMQMKAMKNTRNR